MFGGLAYLGYKAVKNGIQGAIRGIGHCVNACKQSRRCTKNGRAERAESFDEALRSGAQPTYVALLPASGKLDDADFDSVTSRSRRGVKFRRALADRFMVALDPPEHLGALEAYHPKRTCADSVKACVHRFFWPTRETRYSSIKFWLTKLYHLLRVGVYEFKSITTLFYILLLSIRGIDGIATYAHDFYDFYIPAAVAALADLTINVWRGSSHTSQVLGLFEVLAITLILSSLIGIPIQGGLAIGSVMAALYGIDVQDNKIQANLQNMAHAVSASMYAMPREVTTVVRENLLLRCFRPIVRGSHILSTSMIAAVAFAGFLLLGGAPITAVAGVASIMGALSLVVRIAEIHIGREPSAFRQQSGLAKLARLFHINIAVVLSFFQIMSALIITDSAITGRDSVNLLLPRNAELWVISVVMAAVAGIDANGIFKRRLLNHQRNHPEDESAINESFSLTHAAMTASPLPAPASVAGQPARVSQLNLWLAPAKPIMAAQTLVPGAGDAAAATDRRSCCGRFWRGVAQTFTQNMASSRNSAILRKAI